MRVGAAVVLAAAALAACGGSEKRLSKAEYEQTVRDSYGQVQAAFVSASQAAPGELEARIEAAQEALRSAAERLESIEPPAEVEEMNEEIAEGMREYADDLDRLRDAAERGDGDVIAAFNAELDRNEAVHKIAEAAEEMKFKGYDVGPIAAD